MNGISHFGSHINLNDFAEKASINRFASLGREFEVYHEFGRDVIDVEFRFQDYLQKHERFFVQV